MHVLDAPLGQMPDRRTDQFGAAAEVGDLRTARDPGELRDAPGRRLGVSVGDQALDRRVEQRGTGLGAAFCLSAGPTLSRGAGCHPPGHGRTRYQRNGRYLPPCSAYETEGRARCAEHCHRQRLYLV
jgi:hypothetical protein